jgi:nucleotide-binding universal stress UspA family protein
MEENRKLVIVPWDFTNVAEYALAHAVKITRTIGSDICLLHIVDPGINPKELSGIRTRLQRQAEDSSRRYNLPLSFQITKGSIFTSIAEYVNENDASLVVMGTHGMKGMQKLTGSWALKVIIKSKVPFIVVQDSPADQEKYHNIVFPIDFRGENKEKMKMAIFMGKYFDSKIHMLVAVSKDKTLAKKTNINLNFAVKYLIQNNIEYEIHKVPNLKFAQQTIDFAQDIKADLLLIMTTKNITLADYVLGAKEQFIIANSSRIPVCCVNPKSSFASVGQFMGGWGGN